MPASRKSISRPAFTIVELLVVVSVIGLLLAILLPSLAAVNRRSYKTNEVNSLREVGKAWLMYANNNEGSALPGYLDIAVQAPRVAGVSRGWGVQYKYQDSSPIPPAPAYSSGGHNVAGPWTWRLLPYMDYSQEMVMGYRSEGDLEFYFEDAATDPEKALKIAEQPAFGYNGYYIGGYWEMVNVENVQTPRYKYYDHCEVNNSQNPLARSPLGIPTKMAQIRRSSQLIAFCSSTVVNANSGVVGPFDNLALGSHLVVPPTRGTQVQWRRDDTTAPDQVIVEGGDISGQPYAYIPLGRYTKTVAVFYADGHVDNQTYSGLADQRTWIDNASYAGYQHDVCPPSAP